MDRRKSTPWLEKPINVYEVHLGSWMQDVTRKPAFMNYRELAPKRGDSAT